MVNETNTTSEPLITETSNKAKQGKEACDKNAFDSYNSRIADCTITYYDCDDEVEKKYTESRDRCIDIPADEDYKACQDERLNTYLEEDAACKEEQNKCVDSAQSTYGVEKESCFPPTPEGTLLLKPEEYSFGTWRTSATTGETVACETKHPLNTDNVFEECDFEKNGWNTTTTVTYNIPSEITGGKAKTNIQYDESQKEIAKQVLDGISKNHEIDFVEVGENEEANLNFIQYPFSDVSKLGARGFEVSIV